MQDDEGSTCFVHNIYVHLRGLSIQGLRNIVLKSITLFILPTARDQFLLGP